MGNIWPENSKNLKQLEVLECGGAKWIVCQSFFPTHGVTPDASTIWDSSPGLENFIGQVTSPMGDVDIPYPGTWIHCDLD